MARDQEEQVGCGEGVLAGTKVQCGLATVRGKMCMCGMM